MDYQPGDVVEFTTRSRGVWTVPCLSNALNWATAGSYSDEGAALVIHDPDTGRGLIACSDIVTARVVAHGPRHDGLANA